MKSRPSVCLSLLGLFLALAPTALASNTWYVNGVNGNNSDDCKTPTTACKTIAHAISLASSGDSIMVASATYIENLTIARSLKIIGHSANTTIIDGGMRGTVVTISSGDANVTLANLTIRNGNAKHGGGINNLGTLTVNSSVLSGNLASLTNCHTPPCVAEGGGIYNTGTLTLNTSILSGNKATEQGAALGGARGGGISNVGGRVAINNTTLSRNTASFAQCQYNCGASGGAIYNESALTLTLNNSTVSRNNSTFSDSTRGLTYGGGIFNNDGPLTLNNSTLTGNSASPRGVGGGIYHFPGNLGHLLLINNSTLSENSAAEGGAILGSTISPSMVTLQNSIVANSLSGGNCTGSMTSKGYNLSSDGTCNFNSRGDLNNHDPLLGPLQNNGGRTETMALLPGSPAIDAGNPAGCTDGSGHLLTTDQRGMPRPDREDRVGCDIGAYESQSDQP